MKKKLERIVTCHHPRVIKNRFTNELVNVACGSCAACRLKKAARYTQLCKYESATAKYCYFVTLTYANEYIPLLEPVFNDDDTVDIYCEDLKIYTYKKSDYEKVIQKCAMPKIPYLKKEDLQKFIKRFRYYMGKEAPSSKIRYFGVGEYGPIHFRPHLHLILWTDDDYVRQRFHTFIYKAWKFGRVDYSLSRGECAAYVAGYINANGKLSKIHKTDETKPFSTHSFYLGHSFFSLSREKLLKNDPREIIQGSYFLDNAYRDIRIPTSFITYLLPRCKGFTSKNHDELLGSYTLYRFFKKFFREEKVTELTRFVQDFVIAEARDWYPSIDLYRPIQTLFQDIQSTLSLFDYGYLNNNMENVNVDEYMKRLYNNIYHILSVSAVYERHILPLFNDDKEAISALQNFYQRLDYCNLINQLEAEESFFEDGTKDIEYIQYFYVNKFELDDWKHTLLYQQNYLYYEGQQAKAIKHKKLNDLNNLFTKI